MEIRCTFRLQGITDWWRQQEETHTEYSDLSDVARNNFWIIPHGAGVEASFSVGREVVGWRESNTRVETLLERDVVIQFARAHNGILAGADPELVTMNTENNSEMEKEVEERKLHRMAKVHNFVARWQGSQNLRVTQKEPLVQQCRQLPLDTFRTWRRSTKHRSHSFTLMVRLHSNCPKDLLCHQLCPQGSPYSTHSRIDCLPNPKNQPSSSRM